MAQIVTHPFVSAKSDGSDATKVQPSNWNAAHAFLGGVNGNLLIRDTGDPTYGAAWSSGLTYVSNQLLLPDGTAAAPALVFASDPDSGWYLRAANHVSLGLGGAIRYSFSANYVEMLSNTAQWFLGVAGDVVFGREDAAVFKLGSNAAGVTNQMLKGPDRVTSAGVGGNVTFAAGRGFDTGLGGSLIFQTAPAAGAGVAGVLATRLTIDSAGNVIANGVMAAETFQASVAGVIYWAGKLLLTSPVDGQLNFTTNAISAGVGLDVTTDALLKVRTRAQTGYATIDCLGLKASGAAGATYGPGVVTSITVVNGIVTACS